MKLALNIKRIKRTVPAVALSIAIAVATAGIITGCEGKENQEKTETVIQDTSNTTGKQNTADVQQENNENKIIKEYRELLSNGQLQEIVKFLDENILLVSRENATLMVGEFENLQKEHLPELEKKYYNGEAVQTELIKTYMSDFDINKINRIEGIESVEIKELLTETLDTGYKVETAEGSFFPVINYEFYKKYKDYVTDDIKEYIDIMAVESNNPPAKDAGLVINWEEVLNRILNQEKFISKYGDSIRIQEVKDLYSKYFTFALFGIDNTPLFTYDTKTMVQEAKEAYLSVIEKGDESEFLKILDEFMELLKESNYILTDEVEDFRKNIK